MAYTVELLESSRAKGFGPLPVLRAVLAAMLELDGGPEETYLRDRDAELDRGVRLGLVPEEDAEQYRALFRRTAAARKKGNTAVLCGINVYLVCGRKCVP